MSSLLFIFDCRIQSGQDTPKKIYIGPIAPQTFISMVEGDPEDDVSNHLPEVQTMDIEQLDVRSDAGRASEVREVNPTFPIRNLAMDPTPEPDFAVGRRRFIHPDGNQIFFYKILIHRNFSRSRA